MKKRLLSLALMLVLTLALVPAFALTAPDDVISFPDLKFEAYLREMVVNKPTGPITKADVADVRSLDVSGMGLFSLSGIEHFTSLTFLRCSYNDLSELDVSNNTALTELECAVNSIEKLDVSKNTALVKLSCNLNKLEELDVSKNTALQSLVCGWNPITKLDVSKNTALTELHLWNAELTELDIRNNTALLSLEVSENALTELDVSKNTMLTSLHCVSNKLTKLDLSNNSKLEKLLCNDNQLASLDLRKNTALETLFCWNNGLAELDISKNTALESLLIWDNLLTELDTSKNTALTALSCDKNRLSRLDLSGNPSLTELLCRYNDFPDRSAIIGLDKTSVDILRFYPQTADIPAMSTAAEWAHLDIGSAVDRGFVPMDLQNHYSNRITRQEFCRMAMMFVEYALDKTTEELLKENDLSLDPNTFSDTTDPQVLAAYALGIVTGIQAPSSEQPGTFVPERSISRQEAATMLMRVCKVIGIDISDPPASDFTDINSAGIWARDGINFVYAHGIMQGTSTSSPRFNPRGTYTRQESIATFNRIVV